MSTDVMPISTAVPAERKVAAPARPDSGSGSGSEDFGAHLAEVTGTTHATDPERDPRPARSRSGGKSAAQAPSDGSGDQTMTDGQTSGATPVDAASAAIIAAMTGAGAPSTTDRILTNVTAAAAGLPQAPATGRGRFTAVGPAVPSTGPADESSDLADALVGDLAKTVTGQAVPSVGTGKTGASATGLSTASATTTSPSATDALEAALVAAMSGQGQATTTTQSATTGAASTTTDPVSSAAAAGSTTVGVADASTPAPTATSLPESPAAQIAAGLRTLHGQGDGVHTMVVQLHPEELGPVRVVARLSGSDMQLRLSAGTAAGAAALGDAKVQIHDAVAGSGLSVVSVQVDRDHNAANAHSPLGSYDHGTTGQDTTGRSGTSGQWNGSSGGGRHETPGGGRDPGGFAPVGGQPSVTPERFVVTRAGSVDVHL